MNERMGGWMDGRESRVNTLDDGWKEGWMDGWMDGRESRVKDCLQQSKTINFRSIPLGCNLYKNLAINC